MTDRETQYRVHVSPADRTVDIEIDQPNREVTRITLTVGAGGHYGMTINDHTHDETLVIKDGDASRFSWGKEEWDEEARRRQGLG